MSRNIYILSIIFIYSVAALFFGLWAMFHVEFVSGFVIMISHLAVMAFTAQGIEDQIKTKIKTK
jgi:hypothetical protein